jgi:hypothetical protein
MSCFTITVLEPSGKVIQVESVAGTNISTTTLTNYSVPNIELSECIAQLPSDFNDRIFAVVSGDIVASTGVSITSSGGKIYLNSILNSGTGILLSYNSGIYTISSTGLQPSGNYSLVGHQHIISDVSDLQTALDSKQPSGIYASGVHFHTTSDITNFNSAVSGLLPVVDIVGGTNIAISNSGSIYTVSVSGQLGLTAEQVDDRVSNLLVAGTGITLNYNDNSDTLTINTSGLQPSGNYSIVGHSHAISDVSGLQNALDGKQPSGNYSIVGHSHSSSDITNFNNSVSGLLIPYAQLNSPNFSGVPTVPTATSGTNTNQIASTEFVRTEISNLVDTAPSTLDTLNELAAALGDDPNFATTIASGLAQKSNIGHTHLSSDITNFNPSVSGLLSVINISAGSGIGISSSSGNFTVSVTGSFGLTSEEVDDRVSQLLVEGTGVSLTYNDSGNSFTVSVSGLINNPTNNRILTSRDDTTTGIDAESNLTFDGNLLSVSGNLVANTGTFDIIQLNTDNGPVTSQGQLAWNDTEGTVDIALTDNAIINIGEHKMYRIRNTTGNVLYKGQAVMASGVHANGIITPSLYTANGSVREIRFMGLIYENVNHNSNGYVIHFGHIYNIDTRGNVASNIAVGDETWSDGDILYVHPTVASKLTNVEPKHSIAAAIILDAANNGKIFVRPVSYGHLDDNHDVNVSGATNGQFLQYNSATDYWVPSSSGNFSSLLVNGTGVSISGHAHLVSNITDFNSGVSGLFPNNIVTGVGTSGYLTKWIGSTAVSSGLIYDNGTNIGIGTSSPSGLLDVAGNLTFNTFTEKVITNTSSGSGVVLSISSGTIHRVTLTDNCTFTMPTPVAGKGLSIFLYTGSGNYTASFSGVLWNDSDPPTITSTANKTDILNFISDGSYWYGSYSQNYG